MGVRLMVTAILGYWGLMIHAAATAFGWIPGIGGKLKAADRAFHDWSRSVIGKIKDVENTLRGLGSQTGPGKWSLSIAMKGKGHVAQHGFHGWVHGPTTFLAGEAGSERVDITPIRQRRGGGGGGINVYIDARGAIGLNAEQLVNLVHTGLLQKKRRVPSLGLA